MAANHPHRNRLECGLSDLRADKVRASVQLEAKVCLNPLNPPNPLNPLYS